MGTVSRAVATASSSWIDSVDRHQNAIMVPFVLTLIALKLYLDH
jgi:hypothetical protein